MASMYGTKQTGMQLVGAARPCAADAAAARWLPSDLPVAVSIPMFVDVPTTHRHRWPRGSQ